jgi:hypothetical protein
MNLRRVTNRKTSLLKDKNGDIFADFHNILNQWKNCFCQVLNAQGVLMMLGRQKYI